MVFTLLTFLTVLAIGNWDHNALPNHPSFWPITTTAAERDTVAKHFNAGRGTNGALPVNREEVWSQSLPSEEGEDYRYVRYLTPVGGGWDQWEWEHFYYDWSDDQSVTVSQFGGENEATSNRVYANRYLCLADTNNTDNTGILVPNVEGEVAYSPISVKFPDGTCTWDYHPVYHTSGSFISFVRAWDGNGDSEFWNFDGMSLDRAWFCQKFFKAPEYNVEDPTEGDIAYNICLDAPQVEVFYQVY